MAGKNLKKAQVYIEKQLFPFYSSIDMNKSDSVITVTPQLSYETNSGKITAGDNSYIVNSQDSFLLATEAVLNHMNLTNVYVRRKESVTANV